jgi:NAD(P)-dependent dehydrogenase (short-subunit alcohol dehydrogenase family)
LSAQNKTALVTGGSDGIGLAIARDLLARDFNVSICGRNITKLDEAKKILSAEFGSQRVMSTRCDVTDLASVESFVSRTVNTFGGINTLVNNAGIAFVTTFEDITPAAWKAILDTNLTGVYNCCRAALPWLKLTGHSDIVNIGSRAGRYAFSGGVGYNSTKFGLQGFTEALFLDLHHHGIRVSLVAPGTVSTNLVDSPKEDWHLSAQDVAQVVGDLLCLDRRATVNWIEIRPSQPR